MQWDFYFVICYIYTVQWHVASHDICNPFFKIFVNIAGTKWCVLVISTQTPVSCLNLSCVPHNIYLFWIILLIFLGFLSCGIALSPQDIKGAANISATAIYISYICLGRSFILLYVLYCMYLCMHITYSTFSWLSHRIRQCIYCQINVLLLLVINTTLKCTSCWFSAWLANQLAPLMDHSGLVQATMGSDLLALPRYKPEVHYFSANSKEEFVST